GIRVFHVTGVQTCALPICSFPPSCGGGRGHSTGWRSCVRLRGAAEGGFAAGMTLQNGGQLLEEGVVTHLDAADLVGVAVVGDHRSEERRVGKGRGMWGTGV